MAKDYILYVDDQIENLDGFMFTFRKEFSILTADSATKGMELLTKYPVKVVLTDQRMPDITGVEFLEKILPLYPSIVRILVTGFADIEATIQAVNKGKIYHYVTKPWKSEDLKLVIHNAIAYHDLKSQNKQLLDTLTQQNEDLRISKEKAEESERLKTSFLANLQHEIRTPMNGIIGYVSLLQDEDNSKDEESEYLTTIKNNAYSLLHIVNNVLDMALLETDQQQYNIHPFDARGFVSEIFAEFEDSVIIPVDKDIRLGLNIFTEQNCLLLADKLKLRSVIDNIFDNALKFTQHGEVILGIEAGYKDGYLEISIRDSGIGVPSDKFEFIFGRFNKIDHGKLFYEGLGLGLTLANETMKRMNGYIRVTSEIGVGSVFYIGVPIASA